MRVTTGLLLLRGDPTWSGAQMTQCQPKCITRLRQKSLKLVFAGRLKGSSSLTRSLVCRYSATDCCVNAAAKNKLCASVSMRHWSTVSFICACRFRQNRSLWMPLFMPLKQSHCLTCEPQSARTCGTDDCIDSYSSVKVFAAPMECRFSDLCSSLCSFL